MADVRVLLLRTAGTNCDRELADAFLRVGAVVDVVHINKVLGEPALFGKYQILGLPGGFSYGDDIASGKILANQLMHHLGGPLRQFVADGKLVLGVCNGFQVLVKARLLPGAMAEKGAEDSPAATLTYNSSGRFEDRWVKVRMDSKLCKWLPAGVEMDAGGGAAGDARGGGGVLDMPVAHGEGRFVVRDEGVVDALKANDQIALRYVDAQGAAATRYPELPNGSTEAIAGICDITGRVLGLMPHPERAVDEMTHPLFSRGHGCADGLVIFQTAMSYIRSQEPVLMA